MQRVVKLCDYGALSLERGDLGSDVFTDLPGFERCVLLGGENGEDGFKCFLPRERYGTGIDGDFRDIGISCPELLSLSSDTDGTFKGRLNLAAMRGPEIADRIRDGLSQIGVRGAEIRLIVRDERRTGEVLSTERAYLMVLTFRGSCNAAHPVTNPGFGAISDLGKMGLHLCGSFRLKGRQVPRYQFRDSRKTDIGQCDRQEVGLLPDGLRITRRRQISLGIEDRVVEAVAIVERTERFNGETASGGRGNGGRLGLKIAVVLLDAVNVLLDRCIEGDTLRADYQFMEVLAVGRFHDHTGTDIFRHEVVIENRDIAKPVRPRAVLEDGLRVARSCEHNMGRMGGAKTPTLLDGQGVAVPERPEDGSQRRFAPAVLGIHQCEPISAVAVRRCSPS